MIIALIADDNTYTPYSLDIIVYTGGVFSCKKTAIKKLETMLGKYKGRDEINKGWDIFGNKNNQHLVKFIRLRSKNTVKFKFVGRFYNYK